MQNKIHTSTISASQISPTHPIYRTARAAYTEVALGMKPSHDMPRPQHLANNYEYTRLALREHIRAHQSLPNWKPNEPIPNWLLSALRQVRADFRSYF